MHILQADNIRNLRASILQLIYENHFRRGSRLRLTPLHGALVRLDFDISEDDLVTVLEDMKERGYLTFSRDEEAWRRSRTLKISEIQITPPGRDLVEKTRTDPAVAFE